MISTIKPLITVVIPVYNVKPYLDRCIQSVLKQTYANLEILLVDDGSTDGSGDICDSFCKIDKRISVIHKQNGGLSEARNIGIANATGEYITFVDSDDYIDSDMIDYLFYLIDNYNCSMSLCSHRIVKNNGERIINNGNGKETVLSDKECIFNMCYHHLVDTSAWAKLYKIDLFQGVRFPIGKLFEDIATTYRLFLKSKQIACGFVPKYSYWIRCNSITTQKFKSNKLDLLDLTDEMANNVLLIYPDLATAVLRRRVYARFSTLNQMLFVSGYENQRMTIIRFIKKNTWTILKDYYAPKRDKIALIILNLGFSFYKAVWRLGHIFI